MKSTNYTAPCVLSVIRLQARLALCASIPGYTETITPGSVSYNDDDFGND